MSPPHPRHAPPHPLRVDPKIWLGVAGAAVKIHAVNSRVYYFPQGHLEHASSHSPHFLHPLPFVRCHVSNVELLADPNSDEVFAKILLTPISDLYSAARACDTAEDAAAHGGNDRVVSFAKVLTPSDANNGGGFSVPRFCADSIFPALNFKADPPVQVLSVTDVHGGAWRFRHIYRGTPRRHLLTTGWSKFVNSKNLVAGDTVVFMKDSAGSVFAGVRRSMRFDARGGGDGTVSAEKVAEAVELAARNAAFEVVYYPRSGWFDFVVGAEAVEGAMRNVWCDGMRVKMAVETEDSSRMTWFQGTVDFASVPDDGPWRGSPWRMLQVTWDEPECLQNAKRVSPWQVELVSPTPLQQIAFPPTKKFRTAQGSGVFSDGEGDPFFPMTGFTSSTMGQLNQTLLSYDTFPAGMQGARHDLFSASRFFNFLNDLSLGSPSSFHSTPGTPNCNASKVGSGSIQLFGKIIQPVLVENDLHDAGCIGDDGSKGHIETEGIDNPRDHSLTNSKMLNRLDVQCKQLSSVEACYL